jgi:hypothetical protein
MSGCAIQGGAPLGGDQDTTPPKPTGQLPANKTTHFSAEKIEMDFDELVDIADASTEIIFTPEQLKGNPVYRAKGKSVIVDLHNVALAPNTTYTIMFGKAIRDVHEGNIIDGFNYIFSTGDYVDSMKLRASAVNAIQGRAEPGYVALLYKPGDDSAAYKSRPQYYVRADSSGSFEFQNLPKSEFRLYVVKDANANLMIDEGEQAGVYPDVIRADTLTVLSKPIQVFTEPRRRLDILKAKAAALLLQVKFNAPVDSVSFGNMRGYKLTDTKLDSASFWPLKPLEVNTTVKIMGYSGGLIADSVMLVKENKAAVGKVVLGLETPYHAVNMYNSLFLIKSPMAATWLDTSKFTVKAGVIRIMPEKIFFADSSHTRVAVRFPFDGDSSYSILVLPGALKFTGNMTNDTLSETLIAPGGKDYALLNVQVTLPDSGQQWIIELVRENGEVEAQKIMSASGDVTWPLLPGGNYRLRAIRDSNRNGRFDGGNILKGIEPEMVVFYTGTLNLKPNWELEQLMFHVEQTK